MVKQYMIADIHDKKNIKNCTRKSAGWGIRWFMAKNVDLLTIAIV
jgi:hypothetical protein